MKLQMQTKTPPKSILLPIALGLVICSSMPNSRAAEEGLSPAAAAVLDKTLTGTRWLTNMERGKYPWGDVTFSENCGITRMQGGTGHWVLATDHSIKLSEFTLTFDGAFSTFAATLEDGTKICTGKRKAPASMPLTPALPPVAFVKAAQATLPLSPTPANQGSVSKAVSQTPTATAVTRQTATDQPARWWAGSWNTDVTVPQGAYRGKSIAVPCGPAPFKVAVLPGAFIEGVQFLAQDGNAKAGEHGQWKVEGAFFRNVKITAACDTSFSGKDSAFEDCSFEKMGSYANAGLGSTHWNFANCVFGKSFMRKAAPGRVAIDLVDYRVHATGCTFLKVKLPEIPEPRNLFTKLRTPEMGFERCKFIGCEVPETFLVATVDCVFESCTFPQKPFNWPGDMTPVKMRAFYVGTGAVPKPLFNGPVSVDFIPAGKEPVGSTLPFKSDAGRLSLATIPQPGTFLTLGKLEKKLASEIAEAGSITPSLTSTAVSPPAALTAEGAQINSLEEVLRNAPGGRDLIAGGKPDFHMIDETNAWLAKTYVKRPILLRKKFSKLVTDPARKGQTYPYMASSPDQSVIYRGTTFPSRAIALFLPEHAVAVQKVQNSGLGAGDLPIRGVIQKVEIVGRGRNICLEVTIAAAQTP